MSNEKIEIPALGLVPLLRFSWRQLTSMRTALILLLMLGIAAIPGSLIPQRGQNPMKVQELFNQSPGLAKFYDALSLFDVYASPWFSAIYILLFLSLIGCVLPRSFEHFKAARALPPATPKNLDRMEHFTTWSSQGNELDVAQEWFKKNRFRVKVEGNSLSAEKGFLRETGNLLFHLALIMVLFGVSFGALFGMKGEAIVNVGETFVNTTTSYDSISLGRLSDESSLAPFTIKVNRFVAKYNTLTSAPEDYTLYVTSKDSPESSEHQKVVKVNSPLGFGSTNVYLQANGYSPIVTVRDKSNMIVFQGPVPFLPQDSNLTSIGAIKVPDMKPQIGFVASLLPTAARDKVKGGISAFPELLDPSLLLSVWRGDLGLDRGVPQSVYRINTSKMEQIGLQSLKPGEIYTFTDGSISFDGITPWVNLQIVRDPGKGFALMGSILAIAGLLASLFGRRRRIWIRVTTQGKVEVAGLAKNAIAGLASEIEIFVTAIKSKSERMAS